MTALRSSSARRRATGLSLAVRLEMLEPRTLLSAVIGHQVDDLFAANASTIDGNGDLWVADNSLDLLKFHKNADGSLTETNFGGDNGILIAPTSIAYNPVNHDIYVANQASGFGSSVLQQFDLNGTLVATYTTANDVDEPDMITAAPDGSIWFGTRATPDSTLSTFTSSIGRMDLNGNFTIQQLPITNADPTSISVAPDGSVWMGATGQGLDGDAFALSYLTRATLNSDGSLNVAMYEIPQSAGAILSVASAADSSVWYTVANVQHGTTPVTDSVGHATLSGGTVTFTSFAIPETPTEVSSGGTHPGFLTFDSSGQLWFADNNAVDTLDPATGDITRIASNSGVAPLTLSVNTTDVWATYPFGAFNLGDIDLTSFSPPIAATSPDITAGEGQAFSGPVAVFASSDVGNFNYTIDFGNGTTQSGTLASDASGIYTISGSTTYATAGTYATNVTITSDAGDTTSVNGQANVTSASIPLVSQGINLAAQRGQAIAPNVSGVANVVVAQFSGPAGTYTATINWGDSTSTAGQIVALGSNQYYVEIPTGSSKSYSTEGTFHISVVISDGVASTTATSTATISAVPVVASQNLILKPLLGGIVLNTVANFTADTSSTASWFRATINWGDGTHSAGLVVRTSAGHYTVIGLHIYSKKGTYAVNTTILDSVDAESALATASINIK